MKPNVLSYARALSSATRLHIFQLVGAGGMSVTDVATSTGLVPSTVSFHLGQLARVGLVEKRRRGRRIFYRWSPYRLSLRIEKVTPTSASTTRTAG